MDQIQMTRTLLDQGYDYDDLRRLERRGELFRVRRDGCSVPSRERPDGTLHYLLGRGISCG
jgi:hypothetical protein